MPAALDRSSPRCRAFTLVELLVVIVIIALLLLVLSPAISSALARARASTCQANLRQNNLILLDIARENNGWLTAFRDGAGSFPYRPYFLIGDRVNEGGKYTKEFDKSMHCPDMPRPGLAHWDSYGLNFGNHSAAGAEWTNSSNPGDPANVLTLRVDAITSPASYPLFADSLTSAGGEIFRINYSSNYAALRHDLRANMAFADGHAAGVPLADFRNFGMTRAYEWKGAGSFRVVDAP